MPRGERGSTGPPDGGHDKASATAFRAAAWYRYTITAFAWAGFAIWMSTLLSPGELLAESYGVLKLVSYWTLAPLMTLIVWWTSLFLLDRQPTLVISANGLSFRIAFHEFGFFRWDQIAGCDDARAVRPPHLTLTMTGPGLVRPMRSWVTWVLRRIGSNNDPSWLRIDSGVVGNRLDEVWALLQTYLGDRHAP